MDSRERALSCHISLDRELPAADLAPIDSTDRTQFYSREFRADAFNVFNYTNFALPGVDATADISDPSSFGVITRAADPRVLQLALRLEF